MDESLEPTEGLALLGWYADSRVTTEDAALLKYIGAEALALEVAGRLDSERRIALSLRAFDILSAGLLDPAERAALLSNHYARSKLLVGEVQLIDEASLAFYRGYHTAALALLFAVLERFLRSAIGWTPGKKNPTFKILAEAPLEFPVTRYREVSLKILEGLYSWFNPEEPAPLLWNRHGLLHGMRGRSPLDRMNVARALGLFDILVAAETGTFRRGMTRTAEFELRFSSYSNCVFLASEERLIGGR